MVDSVIVFSHPNHEISVLGTIRRLQPHIVFLTDGGGIERVEETKRGLSTYLDPQSLHFLDYKEPDLYAALLDVDLPFYRRIVADVAAVLDRLRPRTVYCDAVEFYNPVHDITLPVVRSALAGRAATVLEIPLVHQRSAPDGGYELQRVPAALAAEAVVTELTDAELAEKIATLNSGVYRTLFAALGDFILKSVPTHARHEQFLAARRELPAPASGQAIRYDRRGRELLARGAVSRAITYRDHYVPVYRGLTGAIAA